MQLKRLTSALTAVLLLANPLQANEPKSQSIAYRPLQKMNYTYAIYVIAPLPKTIDPSVLSLSQITEKVSAQSHVKQALVNAAQKNLVKLGNLMSVQNNLNEEVQKSGQTAADFRHEAASLAKSFLADFRTELKHELLGEELRFQLMIAPKPTATIVGRSDTTRTVPKSFGIFPQDRLHLITPYEESLTAGDDAINGLVYKGMGQTLDFYKDKLSRPFFMSAIFDIAVRKGDGVSEFNSQLVLGLPTGVDFPFEQGTEQIKFLKVAMPSANPDALQDPTGYPVAIIDLNFDLALSAAQTMSVEFGPLGQFRDGRWNRQASTVTTLPPFGTQLSAIKNLTPTLVGLPTATSDKVSVSFHIHKVEFNLVDKALTKIDLFVSAGLKALPFTTAAFKVKTKQRSILGINIPAFDLDGMFETEINNTIQQELQGLEDNILAEVDQYVPGISSVIDPYLDVLLSIKPNPQTLVAPAGGQ